MPIPPARNEALDEHVDERVDRVPSSGQHTIARITLKSGINFIHFFTDSLNNQ